MITHQDPASDSGPYQQSARGNDEDEHDGLIFSRIAFCSRSSPQHIIRTREVTSVKSFRARLKFSTKKDYYHHDESAKKKKKTWMEREL